MSGQEAQAEPLLRECLTIRAKTQPDAWLAFNTQSMLGGALLGQKKYADAEPLLLAGYEGMKKQEAKIPPPAKVRLVEAAERLVQLYEEMGKKDDAAKWRKELDRIKATQKESGSSRDRTLVHEGWTGRPMNSRQPPGRQIATPGALRFASPTLVRVALFGAEVTSTDAPWDHPASIASRSRPPMFP